MKENGRKTNILNLTKSNILFLFVFISTILGCSSNDFAQDKVNMVMKVKVVSLEKCSSTNLTISLVNEVAKEMGVEIGFEHVIVKTHGDAIKNRHIGSPTVQVNGLDIDPGAREINQFGIT